MADVIEKWLRDQVLFRNQLFLLQIEAKGRARSLRGGATAWPALVRQRPARQGFLRISQGLDRRRRRGLGRSLVAALNVRPRVFNGFHLLGELPPHRTPGCLLPVHVKLGNVGGLDHGLALDHGDRAEGDGSRRRVLHIDAEARLDEHLMDFVRVEHAVSVGVVLAQDVPCRQLGALRRRRLQSERRSVSGRHQGLYGARRGRASV
mmetsp:Transcript_1940/g.8590  ORF Transcript_1940/g.8590 Transcript_1940/m.8590 type:complete len:206 (-) Transcript_1940:408-1025(-)|eukprot:scaffold1090_cov265-Pinguiococcus_pyrenoidosus.AAC.28